MIVYVALNDQWKEYQCLVISEEVIVKMREVIEIILVNGAVQKHVMVENYRSTFRRLFVQQMRHGNLPNLTADKRLGSV